MARLAIIGTGIAGLGCAHFLQKDFQVTVFDQNSYPGGHSNTVMVDEPGTGRSLPVDTGFMVFNKVTYPHLTRLFGALGVDTQPTNMSFSVRHAGSGLEYCGSSLNHLFAQRRNLFNPRFYRMLSSISRFNREASAALTDPAVQEVTLGDFVRDRGYGDDFLSLYLSPMASAVWSTPPELMYSFPAVTLLRFFHNHGFLGLNTQHPWFTVSGGSKAYVAKLIAPWSEKIRLGEGVAQVTRPGNGVYLTLRSGVVQIFDKVIIACHGDEALRLLTDPRPLESRLLSEFRYQPNMATVHTDTSVMPKTRMAWASWNYEINKGPSGAPSTATHYWMNSLQGVSDKQDYFVSINRPEAIDPSKVIRRIPYEHPLFNLGALRAQKELPMLNSVSAGKTGTYFAGSYFRYGFHEDALLSAANLSEVLLSRDPWAA
ncbi:MAG TPA: FAD-dependent oxidoreductase [Opitutaceae bacterium]|jgi:predicted NAD/FAD-binding protein|nr:FAD-dependent oxidoreductase [Opitutaceae bacterium]